jgi:small subunit ribosomal protein S16
MGKKKQPVYKIVAADSRSPRDGKYLEAVGTYNPKTEPHQIELNEPRAVHWLSVGAQPTDTVRSILRQKGVTLRLELQKLGKTEEQIQAEMEQWMSKKEASAHKGNKKVKATEKRTAEDQGAPTESSTTE